MRAVIDARAASARESEYHLRARDCSARNHLANACNHLTNLRDHQQVRATAGMRAIASRAT